MGIRLVTGAMGRKPTLPSFTMDEGWWQMVVALVSVAVGAGLGFGLSTLASARDWRRQRSSQLLDRTIELAEVVHVGAKEALTDTPRGQRPDRSGLFNDGRLLIARAKASDAYFSTVLEDLLQALRDSKSVDRDNLVCLAISGAVAAWLTFPDKFPECTAEQFLREAARG